MENSTGSANRTTATPYGRAYPPRFALRPAAYGVGLRLRRGTPAGFPRFAAPPPGNRAGLRPGCLPKARPQPRQYQLHPLALIERRSSSKAKKSQV